MIDQIHLLVQSGDGGDGCESFLRRPDRKAVPHGGDGGDGGSVIFRCDTNAPDLAALRYKRHLIAPSGSHGQGNHRRGRNGKDLVILVPCGTRLYDRARGFVIRELEKTGEDVVVLKGGRGGSGNAQGRQATRGEKGKTFELELSVRIRADLFLVGLPNSGKSRILNFLTRARVKEETYPFATRDPEVGVWALSDYEALTLCEMPSLYEGSHEGRGMGTRFLKHLEKAGMILYVLDPTSRFAATLEEGLATLKKEVALYSPEFLHIPSTVVVNKMDLPESREKVRAQSFRSEGPVFFVSAQTGEGMDSLKDFLRQRCVRS